MGGGYSGISGGAGYSGYSQSPILRYEQAGFSPEFSDALRAREAARGSVLGESIGPSGGSTPIPQPQQPPGPSTDSYRQKMEGQINTGYDQYFSELDRMMGELPTQKTAQENIVGSQYTQGLADLTSQSEIGKADLGRQRERTETSQARNLADLAQSIKNQFMTGQVMLGGKGAGDSSAVNQYSYALTKLGSKGRGDLMSKTADIMSEIDNREFKLNTVFTNEKSRLGAERDQKINEIAQWFSEQTNQMRGMKAQGQLSRGQDLAALTQNALSQAIQAANQIQTAYQNRQGALEQWAMNNASNIQQLRSNMQGISSYTPNLPQGAALQGTPSFDAGGNLAANILPGYGYSDEDKQLA